MKKILLILFFLGTIFIMTLGSSFAFKQTNTKTVLISKFGDHPALNLTTQGIIDALNVHGFRSGVNLNLKVESAQGDVSIAKKIAKEFIQQKPDVVVGIGTIAAQSFAQAASEDEIPALAFSAVTDPLAAGLIKSLEKPGNNTSGVSNFIDLEHQIKLFQQLQPHLKNLGVIYNENEPNSVTIIEKLSNLCPKLKLNLVKQSVINRSDVALQVQNLAQKVDAIFVSNDSTALGEIKTIIKVAEELKKPVYVSDIALVSKDGAVAALGPNQYQVGFQTGSMIARVLEGENMGEQKVEFPTQADIHINLKQAKKAGITVPESLLLKAARLY